MHQYLTQGAFLPEAVAPVAEEVTVAGLGRDFVRGAGREALPRGTLAPQDELVSEHTAQLVRQNVGARAQREASRSFGAWSQELQAATDCSEQEREGQPEEGVGALKLTHQECEELEAEELRQRSAAKERRSAMEEFRQDKRRRPPPEDPLDLLEWKRPREELPNSRPRAVLGVKRQQGCKVLAAEAAEGGATHLAGGGCVATSSAAVTMKATEATEATEALDDPSVGPLVGYSSSSEDGASSE